MDPLRLLLAVLLPPLAVFLEEGSTQRFWIDVVLTLVGWFPGVLFAIYCLVRPARRV
jgi:uncharacterized membrane protein YqaE (UPF0057 family)